MVPYHPQISDGKVFDDYRLSKRVSDWGSSVPGNSPASRGGGARAAAPQGGFREDSRHAVMRRSPVVRGSGSAAAAGPEETHASGYVV